MGGSGDYFDTADTVVMLREYRPADVTEQARQVAHDLPTQRRAEAPAPLAQITQRVPLAESFDPSRGKRDVKISARDRDLIQFGSASIDLRGVEQLVDTSQTRAVGYAIHHATEQLMDGTVTLRDLLAALEQVFEQETGLDTLDPFRRGEQHPGNFARPRPYEIAAAINRLRTVRVRQQ
jgi:predicted ABC-class ATPase